MPDIQTALKSALSKTLQQWDDDDKGTSVPVPPCPVTTTINNSLSAPSQNIQGTTLTTTMQTQLFPIKNNISRVSFDYIKNNPGSTRKEIIQALEHQGYNTASTSSLIAQMARNKMIHASNGLYYADITEYRPIKSLKALQKEANNAPKRKYEKKGTTGLGALLKAKIEAGDTPTASEPLLHTTHPKRFVSLVRNRDPQDILKDMTVYQAHELYVHLKQMFGG
jgi:hypothetical protein